MNVEASSRIPHLKILYLYRVSWAWCHSGCYLTAAWALCSRRRSERLCYGSRVSNLNLL